MTKKAEVGEFDYSDYQDPPEEVGHNSMAQLAGLARDQLNAEALVAACEARLAEAKEALSSVAEKRLPDLMDALELQEFKTSNGIKIKIKETIRGSIPKDNEPEAFKWLEDNNQARLIKRQFIIDFGKDDNKWAAQFEAQMKRRKKPLNCKRRLAVAPPTLQAFVREKLLEGVAIPMDTFGVYRQRVSKVEVAG